VNEKPVINFLPTHFGRGGMKKAKNGTARIVCPEYSEWTKGLEFASFRPRNDENTRGALDSNDHLFPPGCGSGVGGTGSGL
jgi:hypothetical protein